MTSRLNPYLSFGDTAKDALAFYHDVFGGELETHTFAEYGDPAAPEADLIMHGMLTNDSGFTLMAADTPPGMVRREGTSITISLSGDDAAELRGYWAKLSDGGTVAMPLEKQMWGDEFGQCTDKFGIDWLVNISVDQA